MMLRKLFKEARKVEPNLVFNAVEKGRGRGINDATDISMNMTDLGTHVKISGDNQKFQLRKVWKKDADSDKEYKFKEPAVYF